MKKHGITWILIILAITLSACEFNKLKFGEVRMMYGTNEVGRITYDITTFTGTEQGEFHAEIGDVLLFNYTVDLVKGALFIEWQDPQGEPIWQKMLDGRDQGEVEFEDLHPGRYQVVIRGEGSGGRFDVSWGEK